MLVGELIKELEKFPKDMEVMDAGYLKIESVYEGTWTHTNYPYDKPDKKMATEKSVYDNSVHEYDLINQAIESAKCRIYRLKQNEGNTLAHQKKAKNQQELMKITIKALEYYRANAD